MEQLLPLELLNRGDWALVGEVAGDASWVARMAELGIRPGSRVQVLRGGSPCLIQVGGCRLSLRGDQAMQILVWHLPAAVELPCVLNPSPLGDCL